MNKHENIRLLQISDCHLSSNKQKQWCDRYPQETLEKVVRHINDHESNINTVIATGDLSHDASTQSYAMLSEYFSSLKKPVYSLAGNHDDIENMNVFLNKENLSTTSYFITGNWLVILLNTHVPNEEYGYLSKKELKLIESLPQQHKDKYILIAMHHPPIHIHCAWIDKINLLNSDEFHSIIARHKNIKAITFGHVHQDTETLLNDVKYLSCPSTCHQYKPNSDEFSFDSLSPGYRWFDLHHDGRMKTGITRVDIGINYE